jgi:hypothetical protein
MKTDAMGWWIPHQLNTLDYEEGGPYQKEIELKDHFSPIDLGQGPELIEVSCLAIQFHVETLMAEDVVIDAAETVEAVLGDFESGEWEHVHRSN